MNLWTQNTPDRFWLCQPDLPAGVWQDAVVYATPQLGLSKQPEDIDALLQATLGEARLGAHPWQLTPPRRLYYRLKPIIPLKVRLAIKATYFKRAPLVHQVGWPADDRYACFLFETLRQVMVLSNRETILYRSFWPDGHRFGLTLTHDIETAMGQSNVDAIARLEEQLGFRSSFNFVPERYKVDRGLMRDLQARGFEVGVHGLRHDGKLYSSRRVFQERIERINGYMREFKALGFRSPLMHRNADWLQDLQAEYDLSFFDTDPYEPMPGGVMTIWPYFMGRLVEMPYTLVQDSTIEFILKERTPRIWLEKLAFIRQMHGMALVNTHPDYMMVDHVRQMYADFLRALNEYRNEFWHALPYEIARWWRLRSDENVEPHKVCMSQAWLHGDTIHLEDSASFFIETPEFVEHCNDGGTYDGNQ